MHDSLPVPRGSHSEEFRVRPCKLFCYFPYMENRELYMIFVHIYFFYPSIALTVVLRSLLFVSPRWMCP